MDIRKYSDDFFTIGNIVVLQRKIGNSAYDFDFRNAFECKSVISENDAPVLLHIGAVEDYAGVESAIEDMGMKLLVHEAEHLRCSTIEKWYPSLKERTPFTVVYDELPPVEQVLKDFSFPVFIKGNRQTSRHKKSQCIVVDAVQYEKLRQEWKKDRILSWQKVAIREYVPLMQIDADSFPDMVPISYEFRFFYFEGKCMAYGQYWDIGAKYDLKDEELSEVLELTDWAADRLSVSFPAIDVAKTAFGKWIIIEVNDAQESSFVGINPLKLWNNTIDAMQERFWISAEDFFEEGTVIMGGDPVPGLTLEEMRAISDKELSTQELVDAYVCAHNKFWWVEDDDYDEGTEEYIKACATTKAWAELMELFESRVVECAKREKLFGERLPNSGLVKQLEGFMDKYGYVDGRGWWVKKK